MKKLLFLLALLWASPAWAQNSLTTTFINSAQKTVMTTKVTNASECFAVDIGLTNHALTFIPSAGVSALTVTVTGNSNGSGAFPTTAGTSSALGATISFQGTYAALCVTITAFTGGGTVNATYYGNTAIAGGGGTTNDGLGADTYVAYWNSATQIGGDSGFRYNQDPTAPTISLVESDGAANGKWWADGVATGVQTRSLCSDTGTGCAAYETITRSGLTATTMASSATTHTYTGNITFPTDNTYDIGASLATRPRTGYFGTSISVGATASFSNAQILLASGGDFEFASQTAVRSIGTGSLRIANVSESAAGGLTVQTIALTSGLTGNVSIKGGTPVVAGNGTIQLGSQNFAGRIDSTTTGAMTTTVTFSSAYTIKPVCDARNETTVANLVGVAESTTVLTLTGTTVTGDDIGYTCIGY